MNHMNGGDAIVQSLLLHGVDTIFGLPGVQTYPLFDALSRASDRIRLITPRHEQATAYMAYGYAKSTGKVGTYSVVPGPGVLNTGAALCTAYGASTPIVCITGQVPSEFIGSGKGHVHELPDQLATLRTLTKWAARINHPAEAPRLVAEAFHQAISERPRPVALEMPWDIFAAQAAVELMPPLGRHPTIPPDPDEISKAAMLLKDAKNPMIMVGGGAINAADEVLALAELLQAPVVSYRSGRGIVSDEHYLAFNCANGFKRWAETDVLVGIGSRLQLLWFEWGLPHQCPGLKLVNIDIDPQQAVRLKPDVAIVGDAKESARELLATLQRICPRTRLPAVRNLNPSSKVRGVKSKRSNLKCNSLRLFAGCCRAMGSSWKKFARLDSPPILVFQCMRLERLSLVGTRAISDSASPPRSV